MSSVGNILDRRKKLTTTGFWKIRQDIDRDAGRYGDPEAHHNAIATPKKRRKRLFSEKRIKDMFKRTSGFGLRSQDGRFWRRRRIGFR